MNRTSIRIAAVVLLAAAPGTAFALEGGALANEATLTLDQARAAALKTQPGTILDQELEHRKGGSGLRYSFDIKVGSVTHEVGIDAKTGAALQNTAEGQQ